jgi:hypothetical protein
MRTKHERPTSQPAGNANANNQRGALKASNEIKRNVGKNEMCYLLNDLLRENWWVLPRCRVSWTIRNTESAFYAF